MWTPLQQRASSFEESTSESSSSRAPAICAQLSGGRLAEDRRVPIVSYVHEQRPNEHDGACSQRRYQRATAAGHFAIRLRAATRITAGRTDNGEEEDEPEPLRFGELVEASEDLVDAYLTDGAALAWPAGDVALPPLEALRQVGTGL